MRENIISKIALCALMIFGLVYAQAPDTTWTERYDHPIYHSNDVGYSAMQTSDGGYILAISTWNGTDMDMWIVKTDNVGNIQWQKNWSGLANLDDEPGCVRQTQDGGYIVTGYTTRTGFANTDLELIKYSASGAKEWEKRYGVSGNWMIDFGFWVEQTPDNGYIVVGMHSSPEGIWLIKTDTSGNIIWQKTYTEGLSGYCVRETSDGGYIICGRNSGAVLLKTDGSGNMIWFQNLGGYDARVVFEIPDKKYIILGNKSSDFWLIETDSLGNVMWEKTYGGSGTEDGYAMGLVNNGGYILTGRTYSFGAGESDIWLVRTNSNGDTLWTKTLGGSYGEWGMAVEQTQDNGYMVFGYTETDSTPGSDDAWLIKLEVDPGITELSTTLPHRLTLLQSYPNPFSSKTQIRYQVPWDGDVNIAIYNSLGERIAIVFSGYKKAGFYSINWIPWGDSGKRLPAGVYFCELKTDKYYQSVKILLMH
jgi:hypothetical protein